MAACLRSLSLEYFDLILSTSDSGMFTQKLNNAHSRSSMLSSTVERLWEVRLSSGNTTGETEMETLTTQLYTTSSQPPIIGTVYTLNTT